MSILSRTLTVLAALPALAVAPVLSFPEAEAASVTWSAPGPATMFNYNQNGRKKDREGDYEDQWLGIEILNPQFTVIYSVDVLNATTGAIIPSGSSVNVGQALTLRFNAHAYTDVSWFGTGRGIGTPYGYWGDPAVAPVGCDWDDYMDNNAADAIFASWKVGMPTKSISNTTGLTCGTLQANGTMACTVASAGALAPRFNFAATVGNLYGSHMRDDEDGTYGACQTIPRIFGTGHFDVTSRGRWEGSHTPVPINVPAQSITYALTAVSPNSPPATPTITGPTVLAPNVAGTYGFRSTDPDGDTLRYAIDWNNDGTVDQYLPASGYTASGTTLTTPKTWLTSPARTFRALAQDSAGNVSGWRSYTVRSPECSDGVSNDGDGLNDSPGDPGCTDVNDDSEDPNPPTANLTAAPPTVASGNSSMLTWSSSGAASCTGSGFSTGGAPSGSVSTGALYANTNYGVSCGSASDTATVTVTNPTVEITATPDRVNFGGSVNIAWTSSQCTNVTVTRNGTSISTGVLNQAVPGLAALNITGQTTFTASCPDAASAQDTVIVNIVPRFEEF